MNGAIFIYSSALVVATVQFPWRIHLREVVLFSVPAVLTQELIYQMIGTLNLWRKGITYGFIFNIPMLNTCSDGSIQLLLIWIATSSLFARTFPLRKRIHHFVTGWRIWSKGNLSLSIWKK